MTDPLYVIHENDLGERRYQPVLIDEDGDPVRLVIGYWSEEAAWIYLPTDKDEPILYRSRWRAERVARREMRRRERALRNEFKEVGADD